MVDIEKGIHLEEQGTELDDVPLPGGIKPGYNTDDDSEADAADGGVSLNRTDTIMDSIRSSLTRRASIIEDSLSEHLHVVPSLQEIEVEDEVSPLQPEFWKPRNIMSVEDTPFSKRYLVFLQVLFGGVTGNMARYATTQLTSYSGEYVHFGPGTCLWSNFIACFVMAWCNHAFGLWNSILADSDKTNMKQIALHSGITAGFCGSYSTWSSLLIELTFKTLDSLNGGLPLPNHGYGVMEFFSVLLVQMGVSYLGYSLGTDFARLMDLWSTGEKFSRMFTYQTCRMLELVLALLGVLSYVSQIVLSAVLPVENFWKVHYALPIVIGCCGTYLRFYLSRYNGSFGINWFPSGTLMANIIACFLVAVLYILLYGVNSDGEWLITDTVSRMVVLSFSSGFCGSLSTQSSFVNELYNLAHPYQRYTYFGITFITCFIPMLLIDGIYYWCRGFSLS